MTGSRRSIILSGLAAVAFTLAGAATSHAQDGDVPSVPDELPGEALLDIPAIAEAKPGWSWAAVGQMIMVFYSVPPLYGYDNWQCSLADFLTGVQACEAPQGVAPEEATLKLIQGYPPFAHRFFGEDQRVMRYQQHKTLTPADAIHEIRFERPFVAIVQPPKLNADDKGGKDVVLVVGYEGSADALTLIVNDPRQYQVGADPYADAGAQKLDVNGQYAIGYDDFVQQMKWSGTISWIKPQ